MGRPFQTVSLGRARFLWVGNLLLAAGFLFLAVRDSGFGRVLGLCLVVLSLTMAATWFGLERRARRDLGHQPD